MHREREIFEKALEQGSPEERAAFVEHATAGNPLLREAVEALLANVVADTFLETGAGGPLRQSMETGGKLTVNDEQAGDWIGRYHLVEKIGEGGFGVVYRAAQSEPVRRQVALKVIKLGMDTRSIVARFEAERQALALMDHPGIARVLDGGATAAGRPFFVMELVRGVRITDYCEANRLTIRERLSLFIQLCHAVQHAHQKGVIHRDLKPSNVLVTVLDGKPMPKVIDFGVAKAVEEPLTEKTVLTNFHAFIGTPAYTSPEQAEMTGSDVDTRSDIYSLGVILYELLTGVTPFDAKDLTQAGLDGMRRIIKEVEPPTPSTRMRRAVSAEAPHREALPVDRDLDWLVMKCLEKDRTRRFATAQELAADLQRYLNQEPVLARPQSTTYRLGKAIRRHRAAFAAMTAILAVVAAGTSFSVWQALRATRAEYAAERGRKSEESLRLRAERERERALENQRRAELNEYVADVNLAHRSIMAGNLAQAKGLLAKHEAKGPGRFEWRYLSSLARGNEHTVVAREPSSVLSLAASPEWTVVGLQDSVRVYETGAGKLIKTFPKSGFSVSLARTGLLATGSGTTVRVWRTSDWAEVYSLPDHAAPAVFSPDGRWLAAASSAGVRIFSANDGKFAGEIPESMPPFAFSPGGDEIAVHTREGVLLRKTATASEALLLERSDGIFTDPRMRRMRVLAFSPDGESVVAARSTLRDGNIFVLDVWSSRTGQRLTGLPANRDAVEHVGLVSGVAFAPAGQLLASGSHDHSLRLWDLTTRQCVQRLYGNDSEVWAVAFSADGRGVITGTKDGTVRFWPTNTASRERLYEGTWTPLKFSRDGRLLAAINNESRLALLNLVTGEPEDTLQLQKAPFGSWAGRLNDDLSVVVEPLSDGRVRVWDLPSRQFADITPPATPGSEGSAFSPKSRDSGPHKLWVELSPDGSVLLTGGKQNSVWWWNLKDLSEAPLRLEGKGVLFSQNGRVLAMLHDQSIKVYDIEPRSLRAEVPVEAEIIFLNALALSSDGSVLAVGSNPLTEAENEIRLWDTRTATSFGVCKGHTQGVRWLAFSPDGASLASVSDDSTLRFWDVKTQQELLSIRGLGDPIREILFSPNGDWLATRTLAGLRILDGARGPVARDSE